MESPRETEQKESEIKDVRSQIDNRLFGLLNCEKKFGPYNETVLHICARGEEGNPNYIEAAKYCLEQGNANINATDIDLDTPLHCAAKKKNREKSR